MRNRKWWIGLRAHEGQNLARAALKRAMGEY